MRNVRVTIWVMVAVVLVTAGVAEADLLGYLTGDTTIQPTNFTTGEVGVLGGTGAGKWVSLEASPIDGSVYGVTEAFGTPGEGAFYQVDLITGLSSQIADFGSKSFQNLAFSPSGELYAISNSTIMPTLVEIDLETGDKQEVGSLPPYTNTYAFAISNSGRGIIWDDAQWLHEIDLSDGSTTSLGYLPGSFDSFDYGPDGRLYAWDSPDGYLWTIDIANLTLDYHVGNFYGEGLSIALVPEPTTLLLLGFGTVMVRRK